VTREEVSLGCRDELGGRTLEPCEHLALDLVQPPVVLDDADNAQESGPLLRGEEQGETALCPLGLHGRSVRPAGPGMGARSVNAVRRFG
jgi:hypothetical protein